MFDGWPSGGGSRHSSIITHAAKLRGKLLLTVGELDRNVDPASTMQVANALLAADKDFELVVVPGGGHGVGESPALARRRQDFFVRHLHGVEPRGRCAGWRRRPGPGATPQPVEATAIRRWFAVACVGAANGWRRW